MKSQDTDKKVPAVVVGMSAPGLACARSLDRAGVRVYALEANADLPGCRTACAEVVLTREINGPGVVDGLRELASARFRGVRPVLFLTNDNMVRHVAERWDEIEAMYRLSWSGGRQEVLRLLEKTEIEKQCANRAVRYPETEYLTDVGKVKGIAAQYDRFPAILKPARPLGGFKANIVTNGDDLIRICGAHEGDYPFLLQRYIPGDDRSLYFVGLYLGGEGRSAGFTGRKIASHPPAMGQTTAAEAAQRPDLDALAHRFFRDTGIRGPVSVELKLDADGRPWLIEPTVGRTDFWVDCCIANGVNFPLIEYLDQTAAGGGSLPSGETQNRLWMDAERDPRILERVTRIIGIRGWLHKRPRFTFFSFRDPAPFFHGVRRFIGARVRRWSR